MKAYWLNLLLAEVCWAVLAYYFGGNWPARVILFVLLNTLLLWAWHRWTAVR